MPARLSASAYQDLRDCPYRFFALRQLRVSDAPELEAEPDQRDLGNWLHAVLKVFHEERGDQRLGREADALRLNQIGDEVAAAMGLQGDATDLLWMRPVSAFDDLVATPQGEVRRFQPL